VWISRGAKEELEGEANQESKWKTEATSKEWPGKATNNKASSRK
jgi:hypothetical protein